MTLHFSIHIISFNCNILLSTKTFNLQVYPVFQEAFRMCITQFSSGQICNLQNFLSNQPSGDSGGRGAPAL